MRTCSYVVSKPMQHFERVFFVCFHLPPTTFSVWPSRIWKIKMGGLYDAEDNHCFFSISSFIDGSYMIFWFCPRICTANRLLAAGLLGQNQKINRSQNVSTVTLVYLNTHTTLLLSPVLAFPSLLRPFVERQCEVFCGQNVHTFNDWSDSWRVSHSV